MASSLSSSNAILNDLQHDQDLIKMLYLTHNTWGMKNGKDGILN